MKEPEIKECKPPAQELIVQVGTPIDPSNYDLKKVYYIYRDGSFLKEDNLSGGARHLC
jgi:hypothetical protein